MSYRDHEPIRIEEFNGLWKRGNDDSCPLDHFSDARNITYFPNGFRTRDGISVETFGVDDQTINNIRRIYTYVKEDVKSLLVLDGLGNIYHTGSSTPFIPILSIPEMTDFAFQAVAGRAYISPHNGITGLPEEFLYVYLGDGSPARKAGGAAPLTAPTLAASVLGKIEPGVRIFGVVYETDTGFQTKFSPLATITTIVANIINITDIPVSPDPFVVARHIVAARAINPVLYNNDPSSYELFFVPDGRINDNTTTILDVDFYDAELIASADKLADLFEEIAAGVFLTTYHGRLILGAQYGDTTPTTTDPDGNYVLVATARISNQGEPEAFDEVDGLIVTPQDGYPLTNGQEYRDILYIFKNTRTYSYNDNGDVPSTWVGIVLDQGTGASVHGIATILDSGGVNIDYLLITNYTGVCLFNGSFIKPEFSWKIETTWMGLDKSSFNQIQIVNDPISKQFFICLQTYRIIFGDYSEGFDAIKVKWGLWECHTLITTISILDGKLIIGSLAAEI